MENILMLKKTARSVVFAGVVIFGATGAAYAAGAGDQTGQYGDMSGQGGPVDKTGSSAGQSGQGASSGQGSDRPRSSTSGQRRIESRRVFVWRVIHGAGGRFVRLIGPGSGLLRGIRPRSGLLRPIGWIRRGLLISLVEEWLRQIWTFRYGFRWLQFS